MSLANAYQECGGYAASFPLEEVMTNAVNFAGIENWRRICYNEDGAIRPVSYLLSEHANVLVGMPQITRNSAEEFYARISAYERLFKSIGKGAQGDITFQPEDVIDYVGLVVKGRVMRNRSFDISLMRSFREEARGRFIRSLDRKRI